MIKILKLSILAVMLLLMGPIKAQVSVNVNIGSPPMWGPAGYSEVRYYYLPDVEAYYDVQTAMFIYYGDGVWVHHAYLPARYRGYDLYGGYKVVMHDYRGNTPYIHFKDHKSKYAKGYRGKAQKTIGAKPGKSGGNSSPNKAKASKSSNEPQNKVSKPSNAPQNKSSKPNDNGPGGKSKGGKPGKGNKGK